MEGVHCTVYTVHPPFNLYKYIHSKIFYIIYEEYLKIKIMKGNIAKTLKWFFNLFLSLRIRFLKRERFELKHISCKLL